MKDVPRAVLVTTWAAMSSLMNNQRKQNNPIITKIFLYTTNYAG